MKDRSIYLNFLKEKGRPLSKINPGSDEVAIIGNNALDALELIKESRVIILGGDILTEKNNELIYAYQLWGDEYIYLNWCCDKMQDESDEIFLKRCYNKAKESILNAKEIADQFKDNYYVVFVTE